MATRQPTSIHFDEETLETLRALQQASGQSRSAVIRTAIHRMSVDYEENPAVRLRTIAEELDAMAHTLAPSDL